MKVPSDLLGRIESENIVLRSSRCLLISTCRTLVINKQFYIDSESLRSWIQRDESILEKNGENTPNHDFTRMVDFS